jgi:SM-20-related protein
MNFTPAWKSDWGGLLQFIDEDGHVAEAYAPAFNALNILRVPQKHAVSYVTPFAGAGRYSITGWLRGA